MKRNFFLKYSYCISLFVIAISVLTFFIPREIFDPHLGVEVDIFCKSMDSIGDKIEAPLVLMNGFIKIIVSLIYAKIVFSCYGHLEIPIRAPPQK